jgi:hypothetical protein
MLLELKEAALLIQLELKSETPMTDFEKVATILFRHYWPNIEKKDVIFTLVKTFSKKLLKSV